jgi:hypothetical protein
MRDNLLYFGFPEENTIEDRRVGNVRQTKLQIKNAPETITFDRAHRLDKHTACTNIL